MHNFDKLTDRSGTLSYKWDVKDGELPMWVADMDFEVAPPIKRAIVERAEHGIEIVEKRTEKAYPGYYETVFSNDVKGMFTATKNMAVEKYVFPKDAEKILEVDFASSIVRRPNLIDCSYEVKSDDMISGWVKAPTACSRGSYVLHFAFHTDSEFDVETSDSSRVVLRFDSDEVEVRIAVSPVDQYAADTVLEGWEDYSFSQIHDQAVAQWKSKFDKVKAAHRSRRSCSIHSSTGFISVLWMCLQMTEDIRERMVKSITRIHTGILARGLCGILSVRSSRCWLSLSRK